MAEGACDSTAVLVDVLSLMFLLCSATSILYGTQFCFGVCLSLHLVFCFVLSAHCPRLIFRYFSLALSLMYCVYISALIG